MSFEYDKLSLTTPRENDNKLAIDSQRSKQNGSTDGSQFPSTSCTVPYITCHYRQNNSHFEQLSSSDAQRNKRTHNNNTSIIKDTLGVRASVLRDGSRPERETPISLTFQPPSAHLENTHQHQTNLVDGTHNYHNVNDNCGEGTFKNF